MITLHRILVATDLSDYSKEALDYAVHLARSFGTDLYLPHVLELPFFSPAGFHSPCDRRFIFSKREPRSLRS